MGKISHEDVYKIAALTKLTIHENEVEAIAQQLGDVLEYAQRVQEIAQEVAIPSNKNINHDRKDVVVPSVPERILQQAPQAEDGLFVVPKILDN